MTAIERDQARIRAAGRIVAAGLMIAIQATTVACTSEDSEAPAGNVAVANPSSAAPAQSVAPGESAGEWGESRFYIELTEDDIEVQSFVDGPRWLALEIEAPDGATIYSTEAATFMGRQGLSELQIDGWPSHFPVIGDPEHLEISSIDTYLALFPAGEYRFRGETVERSTLEGRASFTHELPGLPEILSPAEADDNALPVLDREDAVIAWEPVTRTFDGDEAIDVVEYEVIVEQIEPFRKLSIHVPGNRTSLTVPAEFLEQGKVYDVELVAIEASDNQTISASQFRTSATAEAPEEVDPPEGALKAATFYIELSEDDIEVQTFTDGSRWDALEIEAPNGVLVLRTEAAGFMGEQGLSELTVDGWPSHFPVLGDPEHLEIPSVEDYLALFPEGDYTFRAEIVDGGELSGSARFTHDLPALPEITSPQDGDVPEVLDPDEVVIRWQPVSKTLGGNGEITVVEYEVVVEQVEPFRKLSVHLPAGATELRVPRAFLEAGRDYEAEVMAIERSGNQSFAVAEFATAP